MADLDERTEREYNKLNAAQAPVEERKELSDRLETKTNGNELEEKTDSMFNTLKKFSLWDWTKMAGTATIGVSIGGLMNLVATTGTFFLAYWTLNRKNLNKNDLQAEMHLGNVMTGVLYYSFNFLYTITNPVYKTAVGILGILPALSALVLPLEYIFKKYNPSKFIYDILTTKIRKLPGELYSKVYKPLYFKTVGNLYKYFAIPFGLLINYVPITFQVAASGIGRYFVRLIIGKTKKDESKHQPAQSTQPALGGAYR